MNQSPTLDMKMVRKQISGMRDQVLNGNTDGDYLKKEFEYLFSNTPSIWFMIKDNETDYMDLLDILLDKAQDFHSTPEDKKESILETQHHEVNELLAEKYVYPVVGKKE